MCLFLPFHIALHKVERQVHDVGADTVAALGDGKLTDTLALPSPSAATMSGATTSVPTLCTSRCRWCIALCSAPNRAMHCPAVTPSIKCTWAIYFAFAKGMGGAHVLEMGAPSNNGAAHVQGRAVQLEDEGDTRRGERDTISIARYHSATGTSDMGRPSMMGLCTSNMSMYGCLCATTAGLHCWAGGAIISQLLFSGAISVGAQLKNDSV